ncbi:polysaccharide deacetylase family protein [Paenibacillus sp. MMS18-CY102]|uniref:polysaccharide deacetylase family protein n=1 Tax=Paenibacillus sp. MMS18-CY102 TaxID=2682849 RepID=UPI001365EBF2|nr:polysaccharide deacetylase family protein [Paenibacillus sp. MMS18-CY102]MWC28225.1 ChbG/HpnK family deacetylase [Paenibacillus sp. MMS18-CY102]
MSTARALGYGEADRLLIINADDFGLCHSSNETISSLLVGGYVSSATLMLPCSWAREAALWGARHPDLDIGVHWTMTSEWDLYKWGPVCRTSPTSSLVTSEGYFPKDVKAFERQAEQAEVKAELIAQLEMALKLGIRPTHADSHMGSLYGLATGRDFLTVVFEVCAAYGLPFRLPRNLLTETGQVAPPELAEVALKRAEEAEAYGIVVLDYLLGLPFSEEPGETYEAYREQFIQLLVSLKPGVSEIIVHPAAATDELQAFHGQAAKRDWERRLLQDDAVLRTIEEQQLIRIGWRELQRLQLAL